MDGISHHLTPRVLVALGALVGAGFGLYQHLQPVLNYSPITADNGKIITAATRADSKGKKGLPYPPDAFPGGREVRTAYGVTQVFEWGPEDGEKVLLIHGVGTPCIALGSMAEEFVKRGCRVMIYDLFGRGYSDAPADLPYDDRLYTSQIFMVLSSSPLSWIAPSGFHILGYSLGGALAAAFATYHANLLRSVTLVCPGGLVRESHVSQKSRFLYSSGVLPEALLQHLARKRLEPSIGSPSADVPIDDVTTTEEADDVDFDDVAVAAGITVRDVVRWQLRGNKGFVSAYMSSIRHAPVYGQHKALWKIFSQELSKRRFGGLDAPPQGLKSGKICLVLAEKDPIVVKDEWIQDVHEVLGEDAVDIHVVKGGHEIAISKGPEIANIAIDSWTRLSID